MIEKLKAGFLLLIILLVSACSVEGGSESQVKLSTNYAEDALSVELQLILGSLLLEDTNLAIDPEMASSLVPYWKMYLSLSESDSAAEAELQAMLMDIQGVMTEGQIGYISGLQLTQESMMTTIDELGIIESLLPEGMEFDGENRPEGMPEGVGLGSGQGMEGDIDPETLAAMQAEREATDGGMSGSRMTVPLVESLVALLEGKIES
jgi:hypothetical protein